MAIAEPLIVEAPGGSYSIEVEGGVLDRVGERLRAWDLRRGPVAVVSEAHLFDLYGERVSDSLRSAGFEPYPCLLPGGESNKTLATVELLYERLAELELDRSAPVLALGGGVIGDMAGFAAATYLRGVPFVQAPTSLLAMVDSSVGGKTGVDLPVGKNLVGAFKQPSGVLIDPAVLVSLPEVERRAGLGEVLKHALIADPALFELLEGELPEARDAVAWAALVRRAVAVKVEVVSQDPFEQGRRAVLNLGHTFGHALELDSGFRLRHGEAVAIGLVAATHTAVSLGRAEQALLERLEVCLRRLGLPTRASGHDPACLRAGMRQDKKRRGKTLRFVIVEAIGHVALIEDPGRAIDEALEYVTS